MSQLDALVTLSRLDRLPRTGWIQHGVAQPESVAGHTLGAAHIALACMPAVVPALDTGHTLALILVHDAPEAESGDLPRGASRHLPAGAKAAMESAIAAELFAPFAGDWVAWFAEYGARESREARFAHACDALQLGVQCVAYQRAGQRGLSEFERGLRSLDCSEFEPLEALRREIVAEFDARREA